MRAYNRMLIALTAAAITFAGCEKKELPLGTDKPTIPHKIDTPKARNAVWAQSEFVLSTFFALPGSGDTAIYRKILTQTKEAGINLVELTFLSRLALIPALDVAEAQGVKTLAQDLASFSGFQTAAPPFTEDTVINNVSWLNNYNMLEGYYVWDEPFTTNLTQARDLRNYFKAHDPSRLAFSVMLPSYGPYIWSDSTYPSYVNSYISTIDPEVVSFDYYPFRENLTSTTLITNDLWKDFGYIRKKALQYSKPLWFYFQAVGMQPGQVSIMNLERIRVQMYAALSYGVKGLSYYTSHQALIEDGTYDKTPMFNDLKALNTAVKNIGNYLFGKQAEQLYHTGVSSTNRTRYYLDNLSSSALINTAPNDLIIGVFGDAGTTKYLMITNKNFSAAKTGTITLKSLKKVSQFNKSTNTTTVLSTSTTSIAISIPAGDAALYIIE